MIRRLGSFITIAFAATLAVLGTIAAASPAQAKVGPNQFFVGQVIASGAAQSQILVVCAGVATVGHPAANQFVEVAQVLPPVTSTTGFTGTEAVEIDATLNFPAGNLKPIPIATFVEYFQQLPIPTNITVPCSGNGVMQFSPYPLDSGRPSDVGVTFVTEGVGAGRPALR